MEVPPLPERVKTDMSDVVENIAEDDARWWVEDEVQRHF
jgi:DNA (cytosine-5)-methyltransferase 1